MLLQLYQQIIQIAQRQIDARRDLKSLINEETQPLGEIQLEQLNEYIEKIKAACDDMDGNEVVRICEEISRFSVCGQSLKTYFDEVSADANDFEYDSACNKAEAILCQFI